MRTRHSIQAGQRSLSSVLHRAFLSQVPLAQCVPARSVHTTAGDSVAQTVASLVDPTRGIALTALASSLPDGTMEALAEQHRNGLRGFLEEWPDLFSVQQNPGAGTRAAYHVRLRPTHRRGDSSRYSGLALLDLLLTHVNASQGPFSILALWEYYRMVWAALLLHPIDAGVVARRFASEVAEAALQGGGRGPALPLVVIVERSDGTVSANENEPPLDALRIIRVKGRGDAKSALVDFIGAFVRSPEAFASMRDIPAPVAAFADEGALNETSAEGRNYCLSVYVEAVPLPSLGCNVSEPRAANAVVEDSDSFLKDTHRFPVRFARRCLTELLGGDTRLAGSRVADELLAAQLTAFDDRAAGRLEEHDSMRIARVMTVGRSLPLRELHRLGHPLSAQRVGLALALWCLTEDRGGTVVTAATVTGAAVVIAATDTPPAPAQRLLFLYSAVPCEQEPPGAATAAAIQLRVLHGEEAFSTWITAASFNLAPELAAPSQGRTRPDLDAEVAAVAKAARAVKQSMAARKKAPLEVLPCTVTVGVGASARVLKANHPTRIGLLNERKELLRYLALMDAEPTPLLHPDVLAYAIYDAMPLGAEAIPASSSPPSGGDPSGHGCLVPLCELKSVLPQPVAALASTPLAWVKRYPRLFHRVCDGDRWCVVRRDVHEALLSQRREGGAAHCGSAEEAKEEEALYNSTAAIASQEEITQLYISTIAGILQGWGKVRLDFGDGRLTRAASLDSAHRHIPMAVRKRIGKMMGTHAGGAPVLKFLQERPDVFVIHLSSVPVAGGPHQPRVFVKLTPEYDPFWNI